MAMRPVWGANKTCRTVYHLRLAKFGLLFPHFSGLVLKTRYLWVSQSTLNLARAKIANGR